MTRNRIIAFTVSALSASAAALVACGDSDPHGPFLEAPDATDAPVLPPTTDSGAQDADADAPSRPDYDASDEPVVCTTTPCAKELAAGDRHFCALFDDGTVRCWGADTKGALGRGESDAGGDAGAAPAPVVGLTGATQISAGPLGATTCVRTADAHVRCWGDNGVGQLGLKADDGFRDFVAHPTPSNVALTVPIARVDVGESTACAVTDGGEAYCWGTNSSQQLARTGANTGYYGPGPADLRDYQVTRIILSQYSTFGVTKDGLLVGWGRVAGRESSLSQDEGSPVPVPLPALHGVTRAATGGFTSGWTPHECAIAGGELYCWGGNPQGVLGTGVPDSERLPTRIGILTDRVAFPQQLALAPNRTCVRLTDGSIQCCGEDKLGQLGRGKAGTFASRLGPATAFEDHAVQVATSSNTTCVLVQGGKIMCWGGNENGELGQGTTDRDPHPTPVTVVFQ